MVLNNSDGGVDTSLLGAGWEINDQSLCSATFVSFEDNKVEENFCIRNVIKSTFKKNGTVLLLNINETAILGHGNILLSTAQIQENGVTIDHTIKCHLGI